MLLNESWHHRSSGTTDKGDCLEFFINGITHENRQKVLSKIYRSRTPKTKLFEIREQDDRLAIYLLVPEIWKRWRHIGWVPVKITNDIRGAILNENISIGAVELAEFSNVTFGKPDVYSIKLRVHYEDGSSKEFDYKSFFLVPPSKWDGHAIQITFSGDLPREEEVVEEYEEPTMMESWDG